MMNLRSISRAAFMLLIPLLLSWSTEAKRITFRFETNPEGGTVKVEFLNTAGEWEVKNPGDDVLEGAKLKITATADPGKEFESMQINGKDVTDKVKTEGLVSVYDGAYAAGQNKTTEMFIVVKFKTPGQASKYKLIFENPVGATVSVTAGGETVVSAITEIDPQAELVISIEVTDNTKRVKSVKLNGNTVEKSGDNWTAKMPTVESTLVVTLEDKPKSKITIQKPAGVELKIEDISASPAKIITEADDVVQGTQLAITVLSVPEGQEVNQVLFADEVIEIEGGKYTVTMPGYTVTLQVILKLKGNALTIVANGTTVSVMNGPNKVSSGDIVPKDTKLVVEVSDIPADKDIEKVTLGDVEMQLVDGKYEGTMPDAAVTLTVVLKAKGAAAEEGNVLTIVANGTTVSVMNGATQVNSGDKVAKGTKLVVAVSGIPADKNIEKVTLGDVEMQLVNGKYEGTMPDAAVTLTVVLKAKGAAAEEGNVLTIVANGTTVSVMNGATQVNSGDKVAKGTKLVVAVSGIPADKDVEKVTLGDVAMQLVDGKYEGTMPDAAVTLTVLLKAKGAATEEGKVIKVTANGATVKIMAGASEVKADTKVKEGTDLVITVTAPAKKDIASVLFNGKEVKAAADKSYKVKMSATEATLIVNLKDHTAVEDAVLAGVIAYPNPMVRELVVANLAEVESLALLTAQGVVIRTVNPNGANEVRLAVEDLPAGMYMLVVERNGLRKAIRIVK